MQEVICEHNLMQGRGLRTRICQKGADTLIQTHGAQEDVDANLHGSVTD